MEGLKPEENESMVTNWEGKEMEELLEAFQTKFGPSEQHVQTIKNFPRRKDELFQHLKDSLEDKRPSESQEIWRRKLFF